MREGVPLIVLERPLGHTNLGITSIYLQGIDPDEIIQTVDARHAPGSLPALAWRSHASSDRPISEPGRRGGSIFDEGIHSGLVDDGDDRVRFDLVCPGCADGGLSRIPGSARRRRGRRRQEEPARAERSELRSPLDADGRLDLAVCRPSSVGASHRGVSGRVAIGSRASPADAVPLDADRAGSVGWLMRVPCALAEPGRGRAAGRDAASRHSSVSPSRRLDPN
jgi:hypothetical protein